jgi:hypothetical protein
MQNELSPRKLLTAATILGLCAIACSNLTPTPTVSPLPTQTPDQSTMTPAMTWISPGNTTFELYNNQQDGLIGWQANPQAFDEIVSTNDFPLCQHSLAVNKVKIIISDAAHKKTSDTCLQDEANKKYCLGWLNEPLVTTISTSGPKIIEVPNDNPIGKLVNPRVTEYKDLYSPSYWPINSALITFSPQEFNDCMKKIDLQYDPTSEKAAIVLNALLRREINIGACTSLALLGDDKEVSPFVANTRYTYFSNNDDGKAMDFYLKYPTFFLQPPASK